MGDSLIGQARKWSGERQGGRATLSQRACSGTQCKQHMEESVAPGGEQQAAPAAPGCAQPTGPQFAAHHGSPPGAALQAASHSWRGGRGHNVGPPLQCIAIVSRTQRVQLRQAGIALCHLSCQAAAAAAAAAWRGAWSCCSCRTRCCRCSSCRVGITTGARRPSAVPAAQHLLPQLFQAHHREQRPLGVWFNIQQLLRFKGSKATQPWRHAV